MSSTTTRVFLLSSACLGAAVIGALSTSHLPFVSDDALISLPYADLLLSGHGLTLAPGGARYPPHGTVMSDRVPVEASTWHPFPQASAPVTVEMTGGAVRVAAGSSGADLSEVVLVRSGA